MKLKTLLAAVVMTAVPTFSFAMGGCATHTTQQQAMSCGEGSQLDAETGTCVPVVSS
jgi:hypothetical protein